MISLGDNSVGARLKRELRTFCEEAKPHQTIMPERKLAERYGISHGSVRRVLDDLTSAGLIYKVQGKGTFVAEKPQPDVTDSTVIYADSWHAINHPHYTRRLEGLTEEARRRSVRLEILNCGQHLEQRDQLFHDLARREVAGLVAPWVTPQMMEQIRAANPSAAVIVTAARRPPPGVCSIAKDDFAMGAEALDYLYARGSRCPLLVAVSHETATAVHDNAHPGLCPRVVRVRAESWNAAAIAGEIQATGPDALIFDDDVIAKAVLALIGRPQVPVVSHYNVGDSAMPDWVVKLQIDGAHMGRLIIATLIDTLQHNPDQALTLLVRPVLNEPA